MSRIPTRTARADERRFPREESLDLYPGLVVSDDRVSGSITVGRTRLPLWAIPLEFVEWDEWEHPTADITEHEARMFVFRLLDMRGEFARLLLVLAEGERVEAAGRLPRDKRWWQTRWHRRRVADQLRRCLAIVEGEEAERA